MLDIDWLFENGNGSRFVWMLSLTSNEALFKCKQVTTVINLLWDKYKNEIFNQVFMPYMTYFFATLVYFTFFLREDTSSWGIFIIDKAFLILVVTNMVIFEILEVI